MSSCLFTVELHNFTSFLKTLKYLNIEHIYINCSKTTTTINATDTKKIMGFYKCGTTKYCSTNQCIYVQLCVYHVLNMLNFSQNIYSDKDPMIEIKLHDDNGIYIIELIEENGSYVYNYSHSDENYINDNMFRSFIMPQNITNKFKIDEEQFENVLSSMQEITDFVTIEIINNLMTLHSKQYTVQIARNDCLNNNTNDTCKNVNIYIQHLLYILRTFKKKIIDLCFTNEKILNLSHQTDKCLISFFTY